MTQVQWVRRVVKPAAFLAAGVPFALLVYDILGGGLGANPIEEITHRTGFWTLTLLTITLSITPARKVLRLNALILLRRGGEPTVPASQASRRDGPWPR